jgi:ATP adenylyltransferase
MPNSNYTNSHIKRRKKKRLMRKGNNRCAICGLGVDLASANLDHIVPRSKGGRNDIFNLRVTHRTCNTKRGNQMEDSPEVREAWLLHKIAGFL